MNRLRLFSLWSHLGIEKGRDFPSNVALFKECSVLENVRSDLHETSAIKSEMINNNGTLFEKT